LKRTKARFRDVCTEMKLLYGLLTTFLASANALNLLPPENGWAKTGSVHELICKSSDPVRSCSWDTPYGKHYPLGEGLKAEGGRLEHLSNGKYECGIKINDINAKDDGIWACNVGIVKNDEIISGKAQSRLNIAQKPSSVFLMDPYNAEFVNVTSETMSVKCVVEDAMPEPVFVWKIDDELMENAVTETENDGQTWTQTLTYLPRVEHNNRSLICQTSHIGFEDGDEREASTIIVFASDGQDGLIAPKKTKPYILDPIYIVVIIAIIIVVCTCVPACIYHLSPWNTDPIQWKTKAPSVEQELDEKKAAATINEAGDGPEKDATTEKPETTDDVENRDELDEAVTEVADDQEVKDAQANPAAPTLTLAQRLVSFFRLRSEPAPKKLDEEDVESGEDKDDSVEKKEEDVKQDETKAEEVKQSDEKEDEIKKPNVGRFSVWKLIKWPRSVAKKSEAEMEEGKMVEEDGGEEKEKAALEEEGEKPMVELEPEDKPEPQEETKKVEAEPQDENKKVEPEPQTTPTKDDEEKKQPSPRTTPV